MKVLQDAYPNPIPTRGQPLTSLPRDRVPRLSPICSLCLGLLFSAVNAVALDTGMVVTANPHATQAGESVLAAGGSAVDAAVAIEAVLSLVEPQSSGLGGGGFMLYYDAKTHVITVYEGREMAPAGATADMFLDDTGKPLPFLQAKNSGLSIGVPGVVAMLELAHNDHGELPWSTLFDHATTLADEGFTVSPRLRQFLTAYGGRLIPKTREEGPLDAYQYFFDSQGEPKSQLVNKAYATTLRQLANDPRALYRGSIATDIVNAAQAAPRAGSLTLNDLTRYAARRHTPLCIDYRQWRACGPPPPSSWVGLGMMLGLLEATDFPSGSRIDDWARIAEAQQLAYADRDQFVADNDFVAVPLEGLLNKAYLAQRAQAINPTHPLANFTHGDPWAFEPSTNNPPLAGRDTTIDHAGTTHFVVIDNAGNVVSMTASVESIFGSSRMAGGMFLNNQLTDFARAPRDDDGKLVANHAEPFKRPRSSMSPTVVTDKEGRFVMATGSPGGNSILAYTLKTLIAVLDWQLSPADAVALPNMVARGDTVRIEQERADPALLQTLEQRGFPVKASAGENSGLSVIVRDSKGQLTGAADPRREGTVATVPAPVPASDHVSGR